MTRTIAFAFALALALVLAALAGCAVEGSELEAIQLDDIPFHICGPDMGVHPDDSVLVDPENPFAGIAISDDAKWDIQSRGSGIAAFYAWATIAARAPHGEAQFYAARNLQLVYERDLAPADQREFTRTQAIRGFQSVLDNFPDSVTWDASGMIPSDLATLAFKAIEALGGVPDGWILVSTADGGERAIPVP